MELRRYDREVSLVVHRSLSFLASSFQPVVNCQIFAGDVVNAQTLRKEKYPREFFPEARNIIPIVSAKSHPLLLPLLYRRNGLGKDFLKRDG